MAALSKEERETRVKCMKRFGIWLKGQGKTQRWAGETLGIYHGYVSNLITGKQVASEEVCRGADKLMGPKKKAKRKTKKPAESPIETLLVMKTCRTCDQWVKKSHRCERPKQPAGRPKRAVERNRYIARRAPTVVEIEAACAVVVSWIRNMPPEEVTPDDVVHVTRGLIAGFTS